MNKLIKAEGYKLFRSTRLFWYTLLISAGLIFFNINSLPDFLRSGMTLTQYLPAGVQGLFLGECMLIVVIMISSCMTFYKRLVY